MSTDLVQLAVSHRPGGLSISSHEVAIRRPLADLVEATVVAACRSEHTARAYQRAIGEFVLLLQTERAGILNNAILVERKEIGPHKATVYDYANTPAAILLFVDAPLLDKFTKQNPQAGHGIKTFLSVAFRDNVLTDSQARSMGIKPYKVKIKRKAAVTGRRLSVLEVQILRQSVDLATKQGLRDRAILDLMLYAGLRREEVANLRLSNFRQDQGRLALIFEGKGGKSRKLFINGQLYKSLAAWLEVYGHNFGDNVPAVVRILKGDNLTDQGLTSQAVGDVTATYGHRSGLATATGVTRLSAHDLRRTFARRAYDCGAGLPAIQQALGHSDPKTTAAYIGLADDEGATVTDLVKYD